MARYLGRRVVSGILTLLVVILLTFFLVRLAPGNPAAFLGGLTASPEYLAQLTERMGLNKPLVEQLGTYFGDLARGDLGFSLTWNQPVNDVIVGRLPATILLMSVSFAASFLIGVGLGVLASRIPYGRVDNAVTITSLIGYSVPQFWVGMILLLVFGLYLGIFPVQGMVTTGLDLEGFDAALDVLRHLAMPALALGITELAVIVRITRASMLEVIEADFVRTARSKGIGERQVLVRHALRNALLPLITLGALRLRSLFAGAILVEAIFGWPGIGTLTVNAMFERDYPMILGITIWAAILTVIINFVTDIAYSFVDPRISAT